MKSKQNDEKDCGLRGVWTIHEFARRDLIDKKQQSRLKMLMGPIEDRRVETDQSTRWW